MLLSQSPAATHPQLPTSSSSRRTHRSAPPCPRAGAAPAAAESLLPPGLRAESLPRHVAVVMDGNVRWARARGMPSAFGHEAGRRALEDTVRLSRAWGIRALTAFAFSHENWSRPKLEVDFLMGLFERVINDSVAEFLRDGIRLRVIGDCSRLPASLQRAAREAEEATRNNSQLDLTLAISYSGRRDVVQACRSLAEKVRAGLLRPEDIDESLFAGELETSRGSDELLIPCPDLLIRTSGELRLSNFLLWQSAYSELFFTDTLWPDFGEADYLEALCSFQSRDRRFGRRNL
ncbi:isoprenyl transferase-like [Lolium rigidum]|uniref:isoprenyl transferase-like n=1 Tax=Lolium rigidum TaxID=89674 RepID=UPI001F5DFC04|nr:isoprenyl transferase-like [Lolium rigidum]